jgi:hypothetical protein
MRVAIIVASLILTTAPLNGAPQVIFAALLWAFVCDFRELLR